MNDIIARTFAERVRHERQLLGWTQADLCQRLSRIGHPIGQATLSQIERAGTTRSRRVTLADSEAIARALGQPLPWMLTPLGDSERRSERQQCEHCGARHYRQISCADWEQQENVHRAAVDRERRARDASLVKRKTERPTP
jgi:transcriptional regulator with XRE-family HTH domain